MICLRKDQHMKEGRKRQLRGVFYAVAMLSVPILAVVCLAPSALALSAPEAVPVVAAEPDPGPATESTEVAATTDTASLLKDWEYTHRHRRRSHPPRMSDWFRPWGYSPWSPPPPPRGSDQLGFNGDRRWSPPPPPPPPPPRPSPSPRVIVRIVVVIVLVFNSPQSPTIVTFQR